MTIPTTLRKEIIQIPEISSIPGLNFRRYQGESDLPAIVALDNLVQQAD